MIGKITKKFQLTLLLLLSFSLFSINAQAKEYTTEELNEAASEIINWQVNDSTTTKQIFNSKILLNAGSESSDWFAIGVGRLGRNANYLDYQALLSNYVSQKYQEKDLLSKQKATEWHRIGLAYLAVGGDPTKLTFDGDKIIDLVKDGTYDRGKVKKLKNQGINGLIFALILLDAMNYDIPNGVNDTRADIISQLLDAQNKDGGFSLTKKDDSDVDITAMTITALAPYYNSEEEISLENQKKIKISDVIEQSLSFLSEKQTKDAGFESWGTPNPESAAQVIIALTALNRNPQTDKQFIKNDKNLIDFLMSFQMKDGGFVHSFDYDKENPNSKPNESNAMASQQVLTALGATIRQAENMRSFYDFRPEMTKEVASQVEKVNTNILQLENKETSKSEINSLYESFLEIPNEDKRYITNYSLLSKQLKKNEIDSSKNGLTLTNTGKSSKGNGVVVSVETKSNVLQSENLSKKMSAIKSIKKNELRLADLPLIYSTYYQANLIKEEKLSPDDMALLKNKMTDLKDVQKNITQIGNTIQKEFYPMKDLGAKDFFKIRKTMKSIESISKEDRHLIFGYEDLEKSYAHTASKIKSLIISVVVIIIILIALIILSNNRKKRKKEKYRKLMMDEDEEYEDE